MISDGRLYWESTGRSCLDASCRVEGENYRRLVVDCASVASQFIPNNRGRSDELVAGVSEAAGLLTDMAKANPGAIQKISRGVASGGHLQTRRMAATILVTICVHESLAGGPGELSTSNRLNN